MTFLPLRSRLHALQRLAGLGVVRIDLQSAVVFGERVGGVALTLEHGADVEVRRRAARVDAQDLAIGTDGLIESTIGGEHQPEAANDTKEGRARNRRTELIVMPLLDELPRMPREGILLAADDRQ